MDTVRRADGLFLHRTFRYKVPGKLSRYYAIDSDGNILELEQAEEMAAQTHRNLYGALSWDSAQRLEKGEIDPSRASFMVWYSAASPDSRGLDVLENLGDLGLHFEVDELRFAKLAPFFTISRLARRELLSLAQADWVDRIDALEPGQTVGFGVDSYHQVPNNALFTNAHQVFNVFNYHGFGQTIGIIDMTERGCRINATHEAFAAANISYTDPTSFISCTSDTQCRDCDVTLVGNRRELGRCIIPMGQTSGYCSNTHTNYVAGRIASSQTCTSSPDDCSYYSEGGWMASKANLVIANNTDCCSTGDPTQYEAALADMVFEGATIVVETFGEYPKSSVRARDIIGDWYARYHNLLIVRAAANFKLGENPTQLALDDFTGCHGLGSVCVGGFATPPQLPGTQPDRSAASFDVSLFTTWQNESATRSGAFGQECSSDPTICPAGTTCTSNEGSQTTNPGSFCYPTSLEVSKPDVLSHATNTTVPSNQRGQETTWIIEQGGNSYAAPVVGALAALYQELCGGGGLRTRAAILAAGYRTPRIETRVPAHVTASRPNVCSIPGYPSSFFRFPNAEEQYGCDYAGGVGVLSAAPLAFLCGGPDVPETSCCASKSCGCEDPEVGGPGCTCKGGEAPLYSRNDRDPLGPIFGDEPWIVDSPKPHDSSTTYERIDPRLETGVPVENFGDLLTSEDPITDLQSAFALSSERTRQGTGATLIQRRLLGMSEGDHLRVAMAWHPCPVHPNRECDDGDASTPVVQEYFDTVVVTWP